MPPSANLERARSSSRSRSPLSAASCPVLLRKSLSPLSDGSPQTWVDVTTAVSARTAPTALSLRLEIIGQTPLQKGSESPTAGGLRAYPTHYSKCVLVPVPPRI